MASWERRWEAREGSIFISSEEEEEEEEAGWGSRDGEGDMVERCWKNGRRRVVG